MKTIKTDVTESYLCAEEAIEDQGFKHVGFITINNRQKHLFEKDGKQYYFRNMDHFNTTIYSVDLGEVEDLDSDDDWFIDLF